MPSLRGPPTSSHISSMSRAPVVLLMSLLGACGSVTSSMPTPEPVKIEADSQDLLRLAGTWLGEFRSEKDDRHGAIFFSLAVDSDTAFGSVSLQASAQAPDCTDPIRRPVATQVVAPIVIRVGALAAAQGSVGGWMRPYLDRQEGCWLDTWFEGRLVRDTLTGMYFSRSDEGGLIRQGSWWVARQRK